MKFFFYSKLQISCLIILLYVGFLFIKEGNKLLKISKDHHCSKLYDAMFITGDISLLLDGITSYTVNSINSIPHSINLILHLAFMLSFQIFTFLYFLYILNVLGFYPKNKIKKAIIYIPIVISILLTSIFINKLNFIQGNHTNYSMGVSAIITFSIIAAYNLIATIFFLIGIKNIEKRKKYGLIMSMLAAVIILLLEIIFHELLISCLAVVLIIISIYLNLENPSVKALEYYHTEMIMGFATLVENKDDNTGGHIRRTSLYVNLIANELKKRTPYKTILTKDYIDCLNKAAPMHDIGKIGISDSILQKPGKLTKEEFEVMKTHPVIGGKIIKNTFGHLDDDFYVNIAYNVAMYHHEKWNGTGYPMQLSGEEIPLCARIMAIADVFDALSIKRCYKEAFPLDECFKIISEGKNKDFDPMLTDLFISLRPKVEKIFYKTKE